MGALTLLALLIQKLQILTPDLEGHTELQQAAHAAFALRILLERGGREAGALSLLAIYYSKYKY